MLLKFLKKCNGNSVWVSLWENKEMKSSKHSTHILIHKIYQEKHNEKYKRCEKIEKIRITNAIVFMIIVI